MSSDFWNWYESNKWELFWYKYRVMMDLDPIGNSTWLKEKMHFAKVEEIRKRCDESDNPYYAITNAHFIDKPNYLEKWWDTLNEYDKKECLIHVWTETLDAIFPSYNWWIPYFNDAGFISNCNECRPSEPITVYRGSEPYFMKGMSWTTSFDMAEVFADMESLISNKFVYRTVVQPESILAIIRGNVVDPDGSLVYDHIPEYVINHQHLNDDDIYGFDENSWVEI